MVIAMLVARVMEMPFHQVVVVVAMRHGFVAAAGAVLVIDGMTTA